MSDPPKPSSDISLPADFHFGQIDSIPTDRRRERQTNLAVLWRSRRRRQFLRIHPLALWQPSPAAGSGKDSIRSSAPTTLRSTESKATRVIGLHAATKVEHRQVSPSSMRRYPWQRIRSNVSCNNPWENHDLAWLQKSVASGDTT